MPKALTIADVAAELGRSVRWLGDNWRDEVAAGRLPPPLHESGALVWSAAQLYAVLDRRLAPKDRAAAAAYRAALAAAIATPKDLADLDRVEADRAALAHRFGG